MAKMVTINIDGKDVECEEGEFILNAARANEIFIPAICYLTRCSPTLACRICLVEADGKQVYACNAKAKDGMQISTSTENIERERRAIMEVYDVNHPLQCGVCDQSGECELQNYTLEMGVDSQNYAVADVERKSVDWGHIHYDPGLCIVCERCVTACKDMIGDNSLKTVARGAGPLDVEYKENMPKDAYAMWNKLNKSIIGLTSGSDMLDCTSCGECAAVCPVGALVDTDYMYTTNAWEQKRIPSTCSHCSAGCQINYEVKHTDINNTDDKIYRVSNEWNYVSLCGAGRYGYDFENRVAGKDEAAFKNAIAAFNEAKTIQFTSTITNEEALILQKLKEERGYKLINDEALAFQKFLNAYSEVSGTKLYGSDLKVAHTSNFIVSVGTAIKSDNPNARYAMNNSMTMNKGAGLYFHPMGDPVIEGMSKNIMAINHAPMQEEAVMYLLLDLFADKTKLPSEIAEYLATFHSMKTVTITETVKEKVTEKVMVKKVNEETGEEEEVEEEKTKMVSKKVEKDVEVDDNKLLALLNAPAKFEENMEKFLKKKDAFSLIIGPDFYTHKNAKNLARLCALVEKYTKFELVMIPSLVNSLGVSLICDLDEQAEGKTIGYNVKGDFTLSALGNGDLDMPALNQQEGTFTSINKRVNPTNVAIAFNGYCLNDIANELGLHAENTIDYTNELGSIDGFSSIAFDDLDNYYTNAGEEKRGYLVENVTVITNSDEKVAPFNENDMLKDDTIVYLANPVRQFSEFTNRAHQLHSDGGLFASDDFMKNHSLSEGDRVVVKTAQGSVEVKVINDNKISGNITYLPTFDSNLNSEALFSGYRFSAASIQKA